jgi:hypothetical protein
MTLAHGTLPVRYAVEVIAPPAIGPSLRGLLAGRRFAGGRPLQDRKFPNDQLVDFQALEARRADPQSANRQCAERQRPNRASAYGDGSRRRYCDGSRPDR